VDCPSNRVNAWSDIVIRSAPEIAPFVLAIMQAESDGDPAAVNARSGATGLMQLMRSTYEDCGIDPLIPEENIMCGINLIRKIRKTLNMVDPERFKTYGLPNEFERKVIAAGYNIGWSLQAGIAGDMRKYKGRSYTEFLSMFPKYRNISASGISRGENYVNKVEKLTHDWTDFLSGAGSKPSIPVAIRKRPKTSVTIFGLVLLALYFLVERCDVVFK